MGTKNPRSPHSKAQMRFTRPKFVPSSQQSQWSRWVLLGSMFWLLAFRYAPSWIGQQTLFPELTNHIGNLPLILMFQLIGGRFLSLPIAALLFVSELLPQLQGRPDYADLPAILVAVALIALDTRRDKSQNEPQPN